MPYFNRLQNVLGLRFIAAATLPLLLFGWFAYHHMVDDQSEESEARLERQVRSLRDEVGDFFRQSEAHLLLVRDSLDHLQVEEPAEIDDFLQRTTNRSLWFEAICRLDEKLQVRNVGLPAERDAWRRHYLQADFSGIGALFGRERPQTLSAAANSVAVAWPDAGDPLRTGKPLMMAVVKMRDGYLVGIVALDRLAVYLQRRASSPSDRLFTLLDRHGTVIIRSGSWQGKEWAGKPIRPEDLSALFSGKPSALRFYQSQELTERALVIPGYDWAVHGALSNAHVLHAASSLRALLFSSLLVAVLLGGGLAFWQARQLVRPLLALRDSTQGVARGDYRGLAQLGSDSYVELNDLSANVLEMGAAVMERETFLRASEERYSSLIAGMGEGLLIVGRNGKVTDCNAIAERIFSRPRQAIVGQNVLPDQWRVIHEDGTPFFPDTYPYHITLRTGMDVNNQLLCFCLPDGQEIWLQMNSRPLWSLHGEVNAAVVTFADVTRLKVAEASLRVGKVRYQELSQQFAALLEGITDRIYLLTPDMKVIWSNSVHADVETAGNGQAEGNCCFTRNFRRAEPCPGCPVQRCFASGRRETGEIVDGHGLTWSLRAFPVKSEEMVTQVVLIAEDVTEALEGERQRERASRLAALGELAAGVAHEINNPISGVINYAQLIVNRAEEHSREHDLARRIIKEGDRIATIVRELLTFAREGSSEMQIVSVREALAEVLSLCESQIRKEAINLHVDLPNDLPKVESRNHQLQQLFLNLISNSRHALAEKYPEPHADKILLVKGEKSELNGRPAVRLIVRDHGVGIPAPLLERVMNPFVTTKPAGVGTGLGLSISFEIAKKHGGQLTIASEHGAWTEVVVDLPALAAAANDSPVAAVSRIDA